MTTTWKVFSLALVACLGALVSWGDADAQKKQLVIALNQDPDLLDPTLSRTYVGRIVFSQICEKLYEIDEQLRITPSARPPPARTPSSSSRTSSSRCPPPPRRSRPKSAPCGPRASTTAHSAARISRSSRSRIPIPGRRSRAARVGWRPANQLPSFAAEAIARLQPGEITEPIRTPSGLHIFKVVQKRGAASSTMVTQVHARHILLETNAIEDDDTVRQKLIQFRQRILGGEAFDAIAAVNSDDQGSAAPGGDLGWAGPGTFRPGFDQQGAFARQGCLGMAVL